MKGGDYAQNISAALPDISGSFFLPGGSQGNFNPQGAFSAESVSYSGSIANRGAPTGTIIFNASAYNKIYGNSETVQPPALSLLPQIRY